MLFLICVCLQNPTLPALNCSVENAHPTVSYYARPQVASYNTYYHSPPHLPPYSAYDFQVCLKNIPFTLTLNLIIEPFHCIHNKNEVSRLSILDGLLQPVGTSD
jgi:hypothetical protein